MSSDPHGAAAHDDDDLDVSLSPATQRKILLGLIVCSLFVIAVAIFVVAASENAGPVVERIQDQRDAAITLVHALFA